MAPHSSTLAWKIPWMEEPGRLQSMGSLRVGHDWATSLSLFTFLNWRRKWQPTPVFLPGEPQGWRSLVGCCLWGRTESDTTKATSSSSSMKEGTILHSLTFGQTRSYHIYHLGVRGQVSFSEYYGHGQVSCWLIWTLFCWNRWSIEPMFVLSFVVNGFPSPLREGKVWGL